MKNKIFKAASNGSFSKYLNLILIGVGVYFVYKIFAFFRGDLNSPFSFNSQKNNPVVAGNSTSQINTKFGLNKLCDEVVDSLNAWENMIGQYDYFTVNRLANLKKSDLEYLISYYNTKYRNIYDMTLYSFIDSQWDLNLDGSSKYDPALKVFKKYGLTKK